MQGLSPYDDVTAAVAGAPLSVVSGSTDGGNDVVAFLPRASPRGQPLSQEKSGGTQQHGASSVNVGEECGSTGGAGGGGEEADGTKLRTACDHCSTKKIKVK